MDTTSVRDLVSAAKGLSDFHTKRSLNKVHINSLSHHGLALPPDKDGRDVLDIRREDANAINYEMLRMAWDGFLQTK